MNTMPNLETYTLVSEETGEIKESNIKGRVNKDKEFYALLFVNNILAIHQSKFTKKEKILALALWEMNNENIVYAMTSFKTKAKNSIGVSPGYVDNIMSEFMKEGLCKRLNRGEYVMNPYYFGKGSINHVKELRLKFDILKDSNEIEYEVTRIYDLENVA